MSALGSLGLRLAAVGMLTLTPLGAKATLFLEAPSDWYRGKDITIELKTDEDTSVNMLSFDAQYGTFKSVLVPKNDPTATLPDIIKVTNPCNRDEIGDICSFFAVPAKPVSKGALVTWVFQVKGDAPLGPVSFDFNLFIDADTGPFDSLPGPIDWAPTKQFQVLALAVPEPSSWIHMFAGLAAVAARSYRRRVAA
jgi:hypothetical protein